ncbi:MAG: hypothetical protein HY912_08115 [Desulfomonile tiedjei]|uniref:Uncharacterized protein n=1 Tax=Desulfomonile tiedjei TaxID=2358 RepID=A0A9D6V2F9_9BACT|nr:hypothetical protein [Desulfomonile tiedjei]
MVTRVIARLLMVGALLALTCVAASAGGPVCPPPTCGPVMAPPPPMCGPAPCPPLAACAPPRPACGPPPCPPPKCKENPLAKIVQGAGMLVTGVVSLPFKLVDCLIEGIRGPSNCRPAQMACAPAPCAPPPQAMCGPAYCGPGMGQGMGMPRPMGMGYGRPKAKRFIPFAAEKSVPAKLLAGPPEGFFGAYW